MWTWQRWTMRDWAAGFADRLPQPRAPVDDEEHGAVEIEPALAQVRQQALAHRRVLRRALAQGQDVLGALRIHAQGQENHVVAEVQAVDQHEADVEAVERHGEPRREPGARERDEPPRHGTLRDRPFGDRCREGVKGAVVLARRDPDGDRFEGARVERILRARVGEARQRELTRPSILRARKRGSTMRRPPSTTSLGVLPPRYAWRSGLGTFFGPQSCARSCSIIVWNTCCPAVRQSPKNAVFASARTSSSGNGTCTVATGETVGAFPADDPVRLLFMAAPF